MTTKRHSTIYYSVVLAFGVCITPHADTVFASKEPSSPKKVLSAHDESVRSVCFSPDGMELASGSKDMTVKLWNVAKGKVVATLKGHQGPVECVCYSADGRFLASGARDQTIRLWDLKARKLKAVLKGDDEIGQLCFSPDGKTIATAGGNGDIHFWNVSTTKQTESLTTAGSDVHRFCFAPNGKSLFSAGDDETVREWNVATRRQLASVKGEAGSPRSLAISPDGSKVFWGNSNGVIQQWNRKKDATIHKVSHDSEVVSLAVSPDGRLLASGGADGTILLSDAKTLDQKLIAEQGTEINSVCFNRDATQLAAALGNGTIFLSDVASLKKSTAHEYKNVDEGFAFAIPEGWKQEEKEKTVATVLFYAPGEAKENINVVVNEVSPRFVEAFSKPSAGEDLRQVLQGQMPAAKFQPFRRCVLGGKSGWQVSYEAAFNNVDLQFTTWIIVRSNRQYTITWTSLAGASHPDQVTKAVSSFRFLPITKSDDAPEPQ